MITKYNYTFLIPSYNRYEKLTNLINQIKDIDDYLVIVLNDGSTDNRYEELGNKYSNVKTITNSTNNGKFKFNLTIKSLLSEAINNDGDYFILLADDLILCDDFTKILDNFVSQNLIINVLSLNDTMWNIPGWIDGAFVSSKGGLKTIINLIPATLKTSEGKSTGIWRTVTQSFTRNPGGYTIKNLNYSLTQHNGNDDSKLHPRFRQKQPIIVYNFYNDFKDKPIKLLSKGDFNQVSLKKKIEGISNGNKIINNEPKIQETPKPTQAIINTPISIQKPNIKNVNTQKPINKINGELFMGKIMKKNLRFGRK
jgi:hypothetical protein